MGWRHPSVVKHLPQLCAKLAPALFFDTNQNITKVKVREVIHNSKKRISAFAPLMLLRREGKTNKRKEEIEAQLGRRTMRTQIDGQYVVIESPAGNQKKLPDQVNKRIQRRPKMERRGLQTKIEATQDKIKHTSVPILRRGLPNGGDRILRLRGRNANTVCCSNIVCTNP